MSPIAKSSNSRRGTVAGEYLRFIPGHAIRKHPNTHRVDPETGCWIFQGSITPGGYATFKFNGKVVMAHRHYYTQYVGPIPEGKEIDHLCRNRACCNPDHLEAVPHIVNMRRSGCAKLTPEIVEEAWNLRETMSVKDIAKHLGLGASTLWSVFCGERWSDVSGDRLKQLDHDKSDLRN